MTAAPQRSQPIQAPARQDAPTTDDICALVQQKMGWHNGADFEDDRCNCDQCEAERDEARKIVSSITELSHATLKARVEELEAALRDFADWCNVERHKLGNVDGYNYWSGEEYGLRRAEIEITKRLEAKP